jgi:hypothetical protein
VVAVKPMAAPEGGGDKVAERDKELVIWTGSCVVVWCLLKRPKTLVAGIAAAIDQVQLSLASAPPRLIQGGGIFLLACLSLVAHRTAEAETEGCSRGAGNRRLEQGYVMYVSHAPGRL